MTARYAHIRIQARREAISTLERSPRATGGSESDRGRAQNWAPAP